MADFSSKRLGTVVAKHLLTAAAPQTGGLQGVDDLPNVTPRALIGIVVAISGNILISLALNLQKLAHKRVEQAKTSASNGKHYGPSLDEQDEDLEPNSEDAPYDVFSSPSTIEGPSELRPLLPFPRSNAMIRDYGTEALEGMPRKVKGTKRSFISPFLSPLGRKKPPPTTFTLPVDIMDDEAALRGLPPKHSTRSLNQDEDTPQGNESDYLKSKLWWLGFLLMNVGELGNFISYAFAPASVVAPLGTFALMANCFFAPLLLRETFRMRDLTGIFIAIIGAVTVVLASNASDPRLDPDALLRAISQTPFIVYSCVYLAGATMLATLSEGGIGRTWVFVDVGLCALFGGFTVLSTKALATLLTLEWIELFTKWITYPLMLVLLLTGVGQIRYLNRALMRFDSKVVIPIQFVLFTLSAIIGSAILYGDFQRAGFHEIVTFLYGCAATFVGVFIIAWSPQKKSLADIEDNHETCSPDIDLATSEGPRLGAIGRRRRATLVLPSGVSGPKDTPALRRKRSGLGMMGISPAQHLLLVHTPPRDIPYLVDQEIDESPHSPHSCGGRGKVCRCETHACRSGSHTRESSLVGRLKNSAGRVGSLDAHADSSR